MSAHEDPNKDHNGDVAFEPTDVATRPVALSVLMLAVFTVLFTIAAHFIFFGFAAREEAASPAPNPLAAEYAAKEPPEPRLQIDPKADLVKLRAAEEVILGGLTWIDKDAGLVRVPIERAMQMLLAKGLPARKGPVPWYMAPIGVAPKQYPEGAGASDWIGHESGEAAGADHAEGAHGAASEAHGH